MGVPAVRLGQQRGEVLHINKITTFKHEVSRLALRCLALRPSPRQIAADLSLRLLDRLAHRLDGDRTARGGPEGNQPAHANAQLCIRRPAVAAVVSLLGGGTL